MFHGRGYAARLTPKLTHLRGSLIRLNIAEDTGVRLGCEIIKRACRKVDGSADLACGVIRSRGAVLHNLENINHRIGKFPFLGLTPRHGTIEWTETRRGNLLFHRLRREVVIFQILFLTSREATLILHFRPHAKAEVLHGFLAVETFHFATHIPDEGIPFLIIAGRGNLSVISLGR